MIVNQVFEKLKELAVLKNTSIRQLCLKSNITEQGLIYMIKNNTLKIDTLQKFSEVLEVPITYFFGVENEKSTKACEEVLKENEGLKKDKGGLESEMLLLINDLAEEKYNRFIFTCISKANLEVEKTKGKMDYLAFLEKEAHNEENYMKFLEITILKNDDLTSSAKEKLLKKAIYIYKTYNSIEVAKLLNEIEWQLYIRTIRPVRNDTK